MSEAKNEGDAPDVYTDGVSISRGPFGLTITFLRSAPSPAVLGFSQAPNEVAVRVRMSDAMGDYLVKTLGEILTQAIPPAQSLGSPPPSSPPPTPD